MTQTYVGCSFSLVLVHNLVSMFPSSLLQETLYLVLVKNIRSQRPYNYNEMVDKSAYESAIKAHNTTGSTFGSTHVMYKDILSAI